MGTDVFKAFDAAYKAKKSEQAQATVTAPVTTKQEYRDVLTSFDDAYEAKKASGYTLWNADQVDSWINTSSSLGQKASDYYGAGGWVTPDTKLVADLDRQLKDASKVRHYFTANRAKFEDPDATIAQVDSLIEGLTALRDGGKSANDVFGKFKSADAYNNAMKQSEYSAKSFEELDPLKGSQDVLFTTQDGTAVTGDQYYNTRAYFEKVNEYEAMPADKVKKAVLDRQHLKMLIDNAEKRLHDHITKYGTQLTEDEQAERNAIINDKRMLEEQYAQTMGGKAGVVCTTPEGVNITPERLLEQKEHEDNFNKLYAELSSREDWAEKSQFNPYDENGVAAYSMNYTIVNNPTKQLDTYTEMTDEERGVFNYLAHTQGEEAAFEWLESSLGPVLEVRYERALSKKILEGNVWTAAGASLASVGASLMSAVEYVGDAIKYIATGEMDTNRYSQVSSTILGAVSQKYDWNIPALDGWDAFDFLYNTGMSMANSVATIPIGGWGAATVLGLSAAASATNAAIERGLDDKHAFFGGIAAGAFETIFEKVSIGEFESLKEGITGGLKDAVKNIGKSMLTNASEETLTEIANIVYDNLANGDLSEYETSIRAKMAQGMSREDATKQAATELGLRVAESAASGALMGFGFGGVGSVVSYGKTSKTGKALNGAGLGKALNGAGLGDALVALGKTMDGGSAAQKFAVELEGKSKLSNADVGKLYGLISQEAQDMTPAQIFAKANAARAAQGETVTDQQAETDVSTEPITPEEIAEAKRTTNMDITVEDAAEADASIDEDMAAFASSEYIAPPKVVADESQITAYQDYIAKKLSKELSRTVYMFDGSSEDGAESAFVGTNGAIYVNKNSPLTKNALSIVTGHEYIHTLEGTDEYNDLRDAVFASETFKAILTERGMTKEQMVAAVRSRYAAAGRNLTTEAAEREVVAQFVAEQLLQNLKALTEFAKTSRFAQFAVRIRRLLARMTHRLGKNADLVKIERLLQRAVREAAKKPAATLSGEVRSYINPNFAAEYAAWDKKTQGGYFYLGTTSKALQSVGIDPSKIYWDKSKIKDILENPTHNMKNAIVKVPDILENPILIMQSQTMLNRVVLISEVVDDNNVPVVCAVELMPNGSIDNFVKIASAYGKDSGLQSLIDKSDILYVDPNKNRTDTWLKTFRLQLPAGLTKYGSIGRVTLFKRNVKGEAQISSKQTPKTAFEIAFEKAQTSTDNQSMQNSEEDAQGTQSSIPFGFSMGAAQTAPIRTSRFTRASVDEQAKQLMRVAGAKGDRAEFARILENFYEYVAQGQELSWDSITDATSPVVDWLTDHHATRNAVDDYAKDVLTEIRAVDMRLTDAQKAEAAAVYGSYGEYHRKSFGSVPFTKHASITLEERWRDLAEVYPEYFDPNENAANMPIRLLEIVGDLRKTNTAAEEYQRNLPEVRRDLAAAVYESYWGVSEARSERDRYEDRVYDLKEQHRAEMREERARGERAVAEERERGDIRVKQERQRAREREQRIKEQNRIQRERATDRQKRTEMREKIRKVVKELNSMLLKGNKEKRVMNGLREAVASALNAVQMIDAEGYEQGMQRRLAYYDQRLYEETDPKKIEQLQKERDDIVKRVDSMKTRLEHLSAAYAEIIASKDASMQIYKHDAEMVKARVETVMELVGDTPLRYMNMRQLEAVHDLYKMVKTTVENANKIFKKGKAEELSKNAESIMSEVAEQGAFDEKGYKETRKLREAFRNFTWSELKPIYAFRKLGSKTLMALYKELRRGEDVVARDVKEASEFADELREKYGWHEWDVKKTYKFKMPDGRTLPLTLPQMMSIYAYSKRPQAQKHIEQGGFVFSDKETFKDEWGVFDVTRSSKESWRVNAWLLTEIAAKMKEIDENCIAYVDEMQEFLSKVMGEKGNEVSRVMWGIDLFKEKYYFPLKSSHDFMFEQSTVNPAMALKSSGMTKRTTPHASNPIVLEGFDQVWAEHVVQMSNYHGFVIPIDNLNKVTNYAMYINEDHPQSVSTVIASVFGKSANEYIEKLLQDVNGGVKTEGAVAFFPKLIGNAKKTAVAASMSTVVQQPTAIVRATAMINSKYFVGKPDTRKHGEKWDEVKKYAPVAILKEIGGFDTTSSRSLTEWLNQRHYDGALKKVGAVFTDSYYRDDKLMRGAAFADEVGWITIWEAVKREQKSKSKLDPKSEEFLQKCGERFTEIIEYTQVYDSTLARSGMMRSKSEFMKMATAFMGEPTTSFNMLLDAVTDGKRSGGKAVLHAGRVVAAVYVSQLLASAAASAIYALRDDDEDEAFLDKWAEQFGKKFASEVWIHNMIPFVRDIASIADGWDVERMDMAIFADLYNAVTTLGSESKSVYRKVEDLAGAIGALGGVPARNILRTGREMYNAVRFVFDDAKSEGVGDSLLEGFTSGWLGKVFDPAMKDEYERTVEAIESGKGIPKDYRDDKTVLTLVDLYREAAEQRKKIEGDKNMTEAEKQDALGDYSLGSIVKSGEVGKSWVDESGELVTDNKELTDEATDLLRRTYKSYLDLLIPSTEFQQASTAERIDMVGDVYDDVNTLFKETFKTTSPEQALNIFDTYQGKVSSGRYDPDVVSAFATVKLADGKPLVTNRALCDRYESAVEEIYERRMREAKGKYEWTKDGVKHTIYTAKATAAEWAFIEERERELARKDVARLFGDVDAATLATELTKWDAYTVKKKH